MEALRANISIDLATATSCLDSAPVLSCLHLSVTQAQVPKQSAQHLAVERELRSK